jgi:hypothetical protein
MQMCTRDSPGLANSTQDFTTAQYITRLDVNTAQMRIQADQALAMIDIDHIATEKKVACFNHSTIGRSPDISAFGCNNIETVVRVTLLLIKKSSQPVYAANLAADRPDKINIRIGVRPVVFCSPFEHAFAGDTLHVLFVGIDLAFVLDG